MKFLDIKISKSDLDDILDRALHHYKDRSITVVTAYTEAVLEYVFQKGLLKTEVKNEND